MYRYVAAGSCRLRVGFAHRMQVHTGCWTPNSFCVARSAKPPRPLICRHICAMAAMMAARSVMMRHVMRRQWTYLRPPSSATHIRVATVHPRGRTRLPTFSGSPSGSLRYVRGQVAGGSPPLLVLLENTADLVRLHRSHFDAVVVMLVRLPYCTRGISMCCVLVGMRTCRTRARGSTLLGC